MKGSSRSAYSGLGDRSHLVREVPSHLVDLVPPSRAVNSRSGLSYSSVKLTESTSDFHSPETGRECMST